MKSFSKIKILLPVVAVLLILSGCLGNGLGFETNEDGSLILEPGDVKVTPKDETDDQVELPVTFFDKGEETTIEDLMATQDKISSYYFEQTIPYTDAAVFLQVWYLDNKMKVITSVDGYGLTEFYYDFSEMTVLSYSPADSDTAIKMSFTDNSEDVPNNPLYDNYANCILLGSEKVGRQLCYILQTTNGDKLWVSTKHGFPLQVEFLDHWGDQYTVAYRNVMLNTIAENSVEFPAGIPIYNMDTGFGE